MMDSNELFLARRYEEALVQARKEVRRHAVENLKCGCTLTIGQCLLMLGRYREAQEHTEPLAKQRHGGEWIGLHSTYAGLAHWFGGHYQEAVKLWEAGTKAGYQSLSGIELPWILLYAAARQPRSYARDRAEQLVRLRMKWLGEPDSLCTLTRFLLGETDYDTALAELRAAEGRSEALLMFYKSMFHFLAGVRALLDGDIQRFHEQMFTAAAVTGYKQESSMLIIAECELQTGPAKWRERWTQWLKENAPAKPKAGTRRRRKSK